MRSYGVSNIWRLLFLQSSRNARTLDGLGFFHVLVPSLRKWTSDSRERVGTAVRHAGYFNADFILASFVAGIMVNLEQRRAAGEGIDPARIERVKGVLSATSTARGSYFFGVILLPLGLTIGSIFAIYNSYIGLAIFLALYNYYHLQLRIGGFLRGARLGEGIGRELVTHLFREQGLLGGCAAFVSGAFTALVLTRAYEAGGAGFAVWGIAVIAGVLGLRKKFSLTWSVAIAFFATVLFLILW